MRSLVSKYTHIITVCLVNIKICWLQVKLVETLCFMLLNRKQRPDRSQRGSAKLTNIRRFGFQKDKVKHIGHPDEWKFDWFDLKWETDVHAWKGCQWSTSDWMSKSNIFVCYCCCVKRIRQFLGAKNLHRAPHVLLFWSRQTWRSACRREWIHVGYRD